MLYDIRLHLHYDYDGCVPAAAAIMCVSRR